MVLAWLANFAAFTLCALFAVVYGRLFGATRTNDMLKGWLLAAGQTWGVVEPLQARAAPPRGTRHASNGPLSAACVAARSQVLLLAFLPLLIKEDTRCGRCFERLRTVYNEAFA